MMPPSNQTIKYACMGGRTEEELKSNTVCLYAVWILINIRTMTWSWLWPSSHHSRKLGWCNIPVNMYIAWRSRHLFQILRLWVHLKKPCFIFQSRWTSMSFHTMPWHNMLQIGNLIRFRIKKITIASVLMHFILFEEINYSWKKSGAMQSCWCVILVIYRSTHFAAKKCEL